MKFLAFALSLRKDSYNRKLVKLAADLASKNNVEIELVNLMDYDLPGYNQDSCDKGFPTPAIQLRDKLTTAQGLLIASPEYNLSYPGFFKNIYDWLSRFTPMPWAKAVLLLSASPSLVGGNRGLWQLRIPFEACGAFVFPSMFSLASAHQAFTAQDQLIDPELAKRLENMVISFVKFADNIQLHMLG